MGNYAFQVLDSPYDFGWCVGSMLFSGWTISSNENIWTDVRRCASSDDASKSPFGWMNDRKYCMRTASPRCGREYVEWVCCCWGTIFDNMDTLDRWFLHYDLVHDWLIYHAVKRFSGISNKQIFSNRPFHHAHSLDSAVPPFQFQTLCHLMWCTALWSHCHSFGLFCTAFHHPKRFHFWQLSIVWFLAILIPKVMYHSNLHLKLLHEEFSRETVEKENG